MYIIRDKTPKSLLHISWVKRNGNFGVGTQKQAKRWKTRKGAQIALDILLRDTSAAKILEIVPFD